MTRPALIVSLVLAVMAVGAADPHKPQTPAERVAGRWRITLDGLSSGHPDILASFAVEGDLLIGTLTVERETINIVSGKAVGVSVSFSVRHRDGQIFKMRGTVGERGLEGDWEAANERGKWRAARVR